MTAQLDFFEVLVSLSDQLLPLANSNKGPLPISEEILDFLDDVHDELEQLERTLETRSQSSRSSAKQLFAVRSFQQAFQAIDDFVETGEKRHMKAALKAGHQARKLLL